MPNDPRQAHNAAIIERIVDDRVKTEHLLRCVVQGCHRPDALGGRCQYCGETKVDKFLERRAAMETQHV